MSDFSIEVDHGLCMSAQRCTYLAPTVMGLDDEGLAVVENPAELTADKAEELAMECPNVAITLHRT